MNLPPFNFNLDTPTDHDLAVRRARGVLADLMNAPVDEVRGQAMPFAVEDNGQLGPENDPQPVPPQLPDFFGDNEVEMLDEEPFFKARPIKKPAAVKKPARAAKAPARARKASVPDPSPEPVPAPVHESESESEPDAAPDPDPEPEPVQEAARNKSYACIAVVTPEHKVAVPSDNKKKKNTVKYKKVAKRTDQSETFELDWNITAAELRDALAAQLKVPSLKFSLRRVTWRWLAQNNGPKNPLGSIVGVQNFWEEVKKPRNKTRTILFIYTREINDDGTPAVNEFVPAAVPKPTTAAPSVEDPFALPSAVDVVAAAVAALPPPTAGQVPTQSTTGDNGSDTDDEDDSTDDRVKRMERKILSKYKPGGCAMHPTLHCAFDKDSKLHFDMSKQPRLAAYASAICLDRASLEQLPLNSPHFSRDHAIKVASTPAPATSPAAASQSPPAPPAAPAVPALLAPTFGAGDVMNMVNGFMTNIAAVATAGLQGRASRYADSDRGSSPVPEIVHDMTLREYCALGEFPDEFVDKLEAMEHVPSKKMKKRTWRECKDAGFSPLDWSKCAQLDVSTRKRCRLLNPQDN